MFIKIQIKGLTKQSISLLVAFFVFVSQVEYFHCCLVGFRGTEKHSALTLALVPCELDLQCSCESRGRNWLWVIQVVHVDIRRDFPGSVEIKDSTL